MKHICIDARMYGPNNTGIGRYVQNLLCSLTDQPNFHNYRFTLLVNPQQYNTIKSELGEKYKYLTVNIPHYSLNEQIKLPFILYRLHPDLVHFPHFNKPIFYFGKSVVTIHDLIKHYSKGKDTTTKNIFLYWPKYWLYIILTKLVIEHNAIIVPTNYWRQHLLTHFQLKPQNIITTYEAVDPSFLNSSQITQKTENYLLYTGNLYPHKNIVVVLKALKKLPDISLKIISQPNIFLTRTKLLSKKLGVENQVEFLGFVNDNDFKTLYHHALAYVFPSLMEGFGLPGLEAQALGCPVICSHASCLPEVYEDSALYFQPNNSNDLVSKIKQLKTSPSLRKEMIAKGFSQVKKYSWKSTAAQTLSYYEKNLIP